MTKTVHSSYAIHAVCVSFWLVKSQEKMFHQRQPCFTGFHTPKKAHNFVHDPCAADQWFSGPGLQRAMVSQRWNWENDAKIILFGIARMICYGNPMKKYLGTKQRPNLMLRCLAHCTATPVRSQCLPGTVLFVCCLVF